MPATIDDTRKKSEARETDPKLLAIKKPHALDAAEIARLLEVNVERGLSSEDVEIRRRRFGKNALQTIKSRSVWRILLDQFASLVVALLAAASLVSWLTGDALEALAIIAVMALNTLVGFVTEWKASRALDALRRQAHTRARVMREGKESSVEAEELVPGDLIIINAGDRVPADARIIEAARLRAEESALTGESLPVEKSIEPVDPNALIAERHSMLYLGTTISAGRAVSIVTATGTATELGRIGKLVAEAIDEPTPLEEKLADLGRRLVYIVLVIAVVVIAAGRLRGDDLWMMIEVGISLAVAAVPEGLPAVTTLILALGVLRMAKQNAIVRRLPAVETLGSASIICTDKTGTLTQNRMTVREYRLSDGRLIPADNETPSLDADDLLARVLRAGVLCNEAASSKDNSGDTIYIGDPTETALLEAADRAGLNLSEVRSEHSLIFEIPFDAETKRMIAVHRSPGGKLTATIKGAPSVVLEACSRFTSKESERPTLNGDRRAEFISENDEMANRALRVLAFAEKRIEETSEIPGNSASYSPSLSELKSGYTFLGLVGMIDPPREEVPQAIRQAREAGIRVVMLTGDQLKTARAIARELGLNGDQEPLALHARDLEGADRTRLVEMAQQTTVFARVSPQDKLDIVEALEESGEIVAVTGDGVNDAPALRRASIGIAMGERGTEVAKEASDVVLADDNFATIVKAIEGGRTIYSNIIKFVHLMFSSNLSEVVVIFMAIILGWPLPLLPLQILWVNLVTDVSPAMALAVEPPSADVMHRRPRSPQEMLLSRRFLILIVWQGAMLAAIVLSVYGWALNRYGEGAHARTIALMTLVAVQVGHMFNCRSRSRSAFKGIFSNPFLWLAVVAVASLQMLAIYFAPLARVLGTERPGGIDWAIIGACAIATIAIVEMTKLFSRNSK